MAKSTTKHQKLQARRRARAKKQPFAKLSKGWQTQYINAYGTRKKAQRARKAGLSIRARQRQIVSIRSQIAPEGKEGPQYYTPQEAEQYIREIQETPISTAAIIEPSVLQRQEESGNIKGNRISIEEWRDQVAYETGVELPLKDYPKRQHTNVLLWYH
ncbi:MAG: hypothetical protein ACRDFB_06340 [Rhabdochlamydiaceae bacterium]